MKPTVARLRALVTHNFWLKVTSILLASILWYAVYAGVREIELVVSVPVHFENVPAGSAIGNDPEPVRTVRVWLAGPRRALNNVTEEELSLHYDLSGMAPGVASFSVDVHDLGVPDNIRMLRASPGVLLLSIEKPEL